jgi:hypothetical protein
MRYRRVQRQDLHPRPSRGPLDRDGAARSLDGLTQRDALAHVDSFVGEWDDPSGSVEGADDDEVDALEAERFRADPLRGHFGRLSRLESGERQDGRGPILDLPSQATRDTPLRVAGAPLRAQEEDLASHGREHGPAGEQGHLVDPARSPRDEFEGGGGDHGEHWEEVDGPPGDLLIDRAHAAACRPGHPAESGNDNAGGEEKVGRTDRRPAASVLLQFATTVQSATCTYPGVDGVTYQLFANPADLKASFDSIVAGTLAKPSADMAKACAAGNWSGTWNRTGKAVIPANGLECDIDSRSAWIVQADPRVNVLFQANLASGDGAALHTWWLKNVTVVEPGT